MTATATGIPGSGRLAFSGSLTSATSDDWVTMPAGLFTFMLSNTFVATAIIERRVGGTGGIVVPCTWGGATVTFNGKCSEVMQEPEGADYRVTVTGFTSGQVDWRLSWKGPWS